MIAHSEELHTPSAAMYPHTVAEIQAIVAIANKYKTPLWTVSTGKNMGYGSAAPATRGTDRARPEDHEEDPSCG